MAVSQRKDTYKKLKLKTHAHSSHTPYRLSCWILFANLIKNFTHISVLNMTMSEGLRNCISSNNQEVYQALRNTSLNTNIIIVQ